MINRKSIYKFLLFLLISTQVCNIWGQQVIKDKSFLAYINEWGHITSYIDTNRNDTVHFRNDQYAGFAFAGIQLKQQQNEGSVWYELLTDSLNYRLEYQKMNGRLMVKASIENVTNEIFVPQKGIKLLIGIDTYMDKYPDWNKDYFPSMLRCERTHFLSYFMTPEGKLLVLASPDAIPSWENEYQSQNINIKNHIVSHGLHRIYTSSLYLLHRLPLPVRHPQNLFYLGPGEKREISLFVQSVDSLENVNEVFHEITDAPVFEADIYTMPIGNTFTGRLFGKDLRRIEVITPRNEIDTLNIQPVSSEEYHWSYSPFSGTGEYTVCAITEKGKIAEMKLYVRPDYSFYLDNARKEALRCKPTTTHHAECFYPLYSYFLARKNIPSLKEDELAEQVYDSIFPVLYDQQVGEMRMGKGRIQDAATMAGVLVDRFQVTHQTEDLENAAKLVDYLIRCQGLDGGYYNPDSKVHYTSVIYLAKSIMEVMNEEKKIAEHSEEWMDNYLRHRSSVIKAIDNLAEYGDNIGTEGQMTFEDGMISCSVTQLALAALKTGDKMRKDRYLKQALALNKKHYCLTQKLIPDSRMNGATLRFWEYQYTVNLMHNAMNSPCGWSAWKYYGSWYLYLLTGEYEFMRDLLNGLGSAMQLLDIKTKELRFGFLPDPYIDAFQYTETPEGSRNPQLNRVILGEQYIPQISNWHYTDPYAWRKTKFGIDNFVHEVYKCMAETMMENAYIIEKANGKLEGINCKLDYSHGIVKVHYTEPLIKNLHVNLKKPVCLDIEGKLYQADGIKWLVGYPDDLQPF